MRNKILRNFSIFLILFSIFLVARLVLAQDFGTEAVNTGLEGSLSGDDPRTIVGRIINIALGFLGVIAVGLIIYAGFLWMTSSGQEEKVSRAKKTLVSAVIGLAIVLASWGIATFILNQLGDATGGGSGVTCIEGSTRGCGCGGSMYCSDGSWSVCVGSDCTEDPNGPETCDASSNPGCQANNDICAPQDYCSDDCTCEPRGSVGDSCDGNPDNGTCEANNDLCGEFLSCDESTCTCAGPPVITAISPVGGFCEEDINKSCDSDTDCTTTCNEENPNGAAGNLVTILGSNFGEYQESLSQLYFGNVLGRNPASLNPVCVNFWSDDQIVMAVPVGVSDGPIRVVRSDGSQDTTDNEVGSLLPDFVANNIVRPGLCSVNPNSGVLGEDLTYQGINLYSGEAYFGNYNNNIQALSSNFSHPSGLSGDASLPNVRTGEVDSFVVSTIGGNDQRSNYFRVAKEADPNDGAYIVSFSPQEGRAGQYVTISGDGFGVFKEDSKVYFGNQEAVYDFPIICADSLWNDNKILVKVPDNINDGNYFIKISLDGEMIDTSELNPNVFQVDSNTSLKTSLCKIEPEEGTVSTPVKVYGEYFGDEGNEGLVRFSNDKDALGTIDKENEAQVIEVNVPAGSVTGPVKVVKNNNWGNELNFAVENCQQDDDCPGQVCCPQNTYKNGRCANSLMDCLIDIPTSVFEWGFSTGFTGEEIDDPTESCNSLANIFGSCQTGVSCPNTTGVCSPYSGGNKQVVGECDFSCLSVEGCEGGFTSGTCTYDSILNKCVKDGVAGNCSLPQAQTFTIAEVEYDLNLTCNEDGNWQTVTPTSCPDNWERGLNDVCVDLNSSCDLCDEGLNCQKVGTEGRCVSDTICQEGAICEDNPNVDSPDSCVVFDEASCDCCCRIGNSAQDCCAPLECGGTCGQDQVDDGSGFGVCSGCANVGTTQAEHDAACNCAGSSGQYCSITEANPEGICSDCTSIETKETCDSHSTVCCFDANQTPTSDDDICRGGSGEEISDNPSHPDYGYCGYYNCESGDPSVCATSTPVKIGLYKNVYDCEDGAAQDNCDICSLFDGNKEDCAQVSSCCFDEQTSQCQGGDQITSGENAGYCDYYDCGDPNATPAQDPDQCIVEAKTSGEFDELTSCQQSCGNEQGGQGQECISFTTASTCDFGACTFPGMSCLTDGGSTATDISDCGACCCNPAQPDACQTEESPDLYCQANVGNCSGDNRGLCCGCEQDSDCGNANAVGCGLDTCCQARPEVLKSSPESGDENICRNAVIQVTFNQPMDFASFDNNLILFEEMEYGNGVCPSGSFVTIDSDDKGLVKIFNKIKLSFNKIFTNIFSVNNTAVADLPDPNKLYCSVPINVSAVNMENQTEINVLPRRLLSPAANHFLVVRGDENLNSQTGVLSSIAIGLNGQGLEQSGSFTEGESLVFNNKSYINSHIVQFKTLSDSEENSGVCAINSVSVKPSSYLFRTTENSIDENDANPLDSSFDSVSDSDKVFSAWAYSSDNQVLHPVTGYFWDWDFDIVDESIATMEPVSGIDPNKTLIRSASGITDGETRLSATVSMDRFLSGMANTDSSCVCSTQSCPENCLNAFSTGDNLSENSEIYIFICNNPWPPINPDGTWSPWKDNCEDAIGGCTDFSYKFYYCRDAGEPGTFDDLPAIANKAVIRGESTTLSCSSTGEACSNLNTSCGSDENGDGQPDGICIWSVMKESYFFREQVLSPGQITSATDAEIGETVMLTWESESDKVASYKVYYGEAGRAISSSREFSATDTNVCQVSGSNYVCQATIDNLENGKTYLFRLSVISENNTESILSPEKAAPVTDQTASAVPTNLSYDDLSSEGIVRFTWSASNEDALFYRLYRGVNSGLYGESFDSANKTTSLSFDRSNLDSGNNYFAVSAVDAYGNESSTSNEVIVYTGLSYEDLPSEDVVNFTWSASTENDSYYKIYRGTSSGIYEEFFNSSGNSTSLSLDRNNLSSGSSNYFTVSAVNNNGDESVKSLEEIVFLPITPSNFSYEDLPDEGIVNFTWSIDSENDTYYKLYRGTSSGVYEESFNYNSDSNSLSIDRNNLSSGNNYFTLSALDDYGNESLKSNEVIVYIE